MNKPLFWVWLALSLAALLLMGCGNAKDGQRARKQPSKLAPTTSTGQSSAKKATRVGPPTNAKTTPQDAKKLTKDTVQSASSTPKQAANQDAAQQSLAQQTALMVGEWTCVQEQPLMKLSTTDNFTAEQLVKSEGTIEFRVPEGPTLNIFQESESRWSIRDRLLCEVPLKMNLTQTSGAQSVHIDNLLKSMNEQAQARIKGRLATCKTLVSLNEEAFVVSVPQKNVETRCTRKGK